MCNMGTESGLQVCNIFLGYRITVAFFILPDERHKGKSFGFFNFLNTNFRHEFNELRN